MATDFSDLPPEILREIDKHLSGADSLKFRNVNTGTRIALPLNDVYRVHINDAAVSREFFGNVNSGNIGEGKYQKYIGWIFLADRIIEALSEEPPREVNKNYLSLILAEGLDIYDELYKDRASNEEKLNIIAERRSALSLKYLFL